MVSILWGRRTARTRDYCSKLIAHANGESVTITKYMASCVASEKLTITGELIDGAFIFVDLIHQDFEAPSMIVWTSSGSSFSERFVKLATSANITVTSFRSPSMEVRVVRILSARCFGV